MKKVTTKQAKELVRLRDLSLTIIDYFPQNSGQDVTALFLQNLRKVINQTHDENNLRGLQMIFSDVTEMAKGMNSEQIESLNHILKNKFGEDLHNIKQKIEAILLKGVIHTRSEYKLIFDYFEEIYSDKSNADETNKINR